MTPRQIALVRDSFAEVVRDQDHATGLFYHRFMTIAPDVRPLFQDDVIARGRRMVAAMGVLIVGLDDPDTTMPVAAEMGRKHRTYGVQPDHYAAFTAAWIWTLKEGLRDDFDQETEEAWAEVMTLISAAMIEG